VEPEPIEYVLLVVVVVVVVVAEAALVIDPEVVDSAPAPHRTCILSQSINPC
jgi:hypothetical protein